MHNFGILAAKEPYFIYRSAELGSEGLKQMKVLLDGLDLPFPKTIIYMNAEGYAFPLYFAIQEWKAQAEYDFKYYHPFGDPRTYLDGVDPYKATDNIDKAKYLGVVGRRYFQRGNGQIIGGISNLVTILKLILDPANQPVLFHCLGGFHRTGMVAMLIRVIQGMTWGDIIEEYHKFNPLFPRQKNIDFVNRFADDRRFIELWDKHSIPLMIQS